MTRAGRPSGTSGRPQAMTKTAVVAMRKKAMVYAEEALATMVEIMRDEEADKAVRLKAANDVLNRGFGTPVSTQVVQQISDSEQTSLVSVDAIGDADTESLMAALSAIQTYAQRQLAENRDVIDVTPNMPSGYPES